MSQLSFSKEAKNMTNITTYYNCNRCRNDTFYFIPKTKRSNNMLIGVPTGLILDKDFICNNCLSPSEWMVLVCLFITLHNLGY